MPDAKFDEPAMRVMTSNEMSVNPARGLRFGYEPASARPANSDCRNQLSRSPVPLSSGQKIRRRWLTQAFIANTAQHGRRRLDLRVP